MKLPYQRGMPRSVCYECGRTAMRFWGRLSVCGTHWREDKREDPDAHKCPVCKAEQSPQCEWHGKPCEACKHD